MNHAVAATATALRSSCVASTCQRSSPVEWMKSSGQFVNVTAGMPMIPMLNTCESVLLWNGIMRASNRSRVPSGDTIGRV